MMRLDAIREMIIEARREDRAARPFPSGVAAGDNRSGYLNASEAGRCTRQLWYAKHNVAAGETDPPYGVYDRGHGFEHWLVTYLGSALDNAGGSLLYAGAQQRRLTLPTFRLAGTPDGLIEWPNRSESVVEVKSHNAAYNYDSSPSEMHARQAELNIELFHETTAHRPDDAIIVYGLTEDYFRLTLHRVERRPAVFIEALGKAAAVFDSASAAETTAEGVITRQCVICPYNCRCAAALAHPSPAAGTGGLDEETLNDLDRLVAAHKRAAEAEGEAMQARAEVEAEIVARLANTSSGKVKRNGYAIRLKASKDGPAVLELNSA